MSSNKTPITPSLVKRLQYNAYRANQKVLSLEAEAIQLRRVGDDLTSGQQQRLEQLSSQAMQLRQRIAQGLAPDPDDGFCVRCRAADAVVSDGWSDFKSRCNKCRPSTMNSTSSPVQPAPDTAPGDGH